MTTFDIQSKLELMLDPKVTAFQNTLKSLDGTVVIKSNGLTNINGRKVKIPLTVNVLDQVDNLKLLKSKRMIEYHDMYSRLIMSDKITKQEEFRYNELVNMITNIDKEIEKLYVYLEKVNQPNEDNRQRLQSRYSQLLQQAANLSPSDAKSTSENLSIFNKSMKIQQELYDMKQSFDNRRIQFYVEETPNSSTIDVTEVLVEPSFSEKKEEKKKTNVKKDKSKKVLKKVSPKQLENIKENIKKIMASNYLKPKNKDECVSQKRSQPYFMSLKSLLEEIDKHPELKAILPSNWKTLSKEKLCGILYEANVTSL